jgi:predicted nucleic acid-binding protein
LTAVVSDATALIVLAKLGRLSLLQPIFSGVIIPDSVYQEILAKADHDHLVWQDPFFTRTPDPHDRIQAELLSILDPGESAALALAKQRGLPVLIDEKKGRNLARSLGIPVIGLLGVLLALYRKQVVDRTSLVTLLAEARELGFRVSDRLMAELESELERLGV